MYWETQTCHFKFNCSLIFFIYSFSDEDPICSKVIPNIYCMVSDRHKPIYIFAAPAKINITKCSVLRVTYPGCVRMTPTHSHNSKLRWLHLQCK